MKKFKILRYTLIISLAIGMFSCNEDNEAIIGHFPDTPINFEDINSEYDDYNSASPYDLYSQLPLIFSSNRESEGQNFNLVSFILDFYYTEATNTVNFNILEKNYYYYDSLFLKTNSSFNEYGPIMLFDYSVYKDIYMFSSDRNDNLDIYYVSGNNSTPDQLSDVIPVEKINTGYNESYPTLNSLGTKLYFCSDSIGNFDIYHVNFSNSFYNWLQTEERPLWNSTDILNSTDDDKCPYINGNLLVFTSNRTGGYGGYDLYYSKLLNGEWSSPVNFGPEINTEFDEFRPITIFAYSYSNDLMIFSSNRPGGLGGFDLYYVGIPSMML